MSKVLIVKRILGEGAQSVVCTCDDQVALKVDTSKKPDLLKNEFDLLKRLDGHQNIVKAFTFNDKGSMTVIN